MSEIVSASGTCIAISATLPATHDAAGFAAAIYTQLGGLESIGDLTVSHGSGSFTNLCTGKTAPIKGPEDITSVDITVAYLANEAGQALMSAARKSKNPYAFQVTYPDGSKAYFKAYVMREGKQTPSTTDAIKIPYSVSIVPATTGDTIVEVAAP